MPEQIRFAGGAAGRDPHLCVGRLSHSRRADPRSDHGPDPGDHPQLALQSDRRMVPEDDLREIVPRRAARGVLVISDETYERFVYDDSRHASAARLAAEFPDTVVVVGSFSKTYAMTGWRIGYLLGPPPVVKAAADDPEPRHLQPDLLRHGRRARGAAPRGAGGPGDDRRVPGPARPAGAATQPASRLRVPSAGRRVLCLSATWPAPTGPDGRARRPSRSACSRKPTSRWSRARRSAPTTTSASLSPARGRLSTRVSGAWRSSLPGLSVFLTRDRSEVP